MFNNFKINIFPFELSKKFSLFNCKFLNNLSCAGKHIWQLCLCILCHYQCLPDCCWKSFVKDSCVREKHGNAKICATTKNSKTKLCSSLIASMENYKINTSKFSFGGSGQMFAVKAKLYAGIVKLMSWCKKHRIAAIMALSSMHLSVLTKFSYRATSHESVL